MYTIQDNKSKIKVDLLMNIWLLRHGEAEWTISTDEARNLTAYGQQEVLAVAEQLKDKKIDVVLQSPYVRACQTADIVKKAISYQGKTEQMDWLTPDNNPKEVLLKLEPYEDKNILIVSHQPLLGYLVGLLVDGKLLGVPLKTAELVDLEGEHICMGSMYLKK